MSSEKSALIPTISYGGYNIVNIFGKNATTISGPYGDKNIVRFIINTQYLVYHVVTNMKNFKDEFSIIYDDQLQINKLKIKTESSLVVDFYMFNSSNVIQYRNSLFVKYGYYEQLWNKFYLKDDTDVYGFTLGASGQYYFKKLYMQFNMFK